MAEVRLLAVENKVVRHKNAARQTLQFWLAVENLAYHKQVDVVWAGRDGHWQTLSAAYLGPNGERHEFWQACLNLHGQSAKLLAGDVQFAVRLRCDAGEFWDNNGGINHLSRQGSEVCLAPDQTMQNLALEPQLKDRQPFVQVRVAVDPKLRAQMVVLHWTDDNWSHSHRSRCYHHKRQKPGSAQIWSANLRAADAFTLQFSICCQTPDRDIWDDNGGRNYQASRKPLAVMVLNLHCYQEDRQEYKFDQIAKAIEDEAVDVVCLQEVAEHWNDGRGDWASNAANLINQRLARPMQLYTDWSHLGFDQYREGVAILSRYPMLHTEARYVSDSHDAYSIHSRKVVMARLNVPYMGVVDVYSAHLSWWEDGFAAQFERLSQWAEAMSAGEVETTLLCGDFNINAGSIGYQSVVKGKQYEDQYLAANHQGLFERIFRVDDAHWGGLPADDYRIDYIFMNKAAALKVIAAKVIFTDWDYGRVSDHVGYLMHFEPR